jgi:two-component system LytT family sensor kinase
VPTATLSDSIAAAPELTPAADVRLTRPTTGSGRRLRTALWAFALWTGLALFFASQIYLLGGPDMTWQLALRYAMPRWYVWGLLTPGIVAVDSRLLGSRPLAARLAWHVPLALAWTGLALTIRLVLRPLEGNAPPPSILVYVLGRVYWDMLIYAVIAGVAIARDYAAEVRAQERRSHELRIKAVELQHLLTETRLQSLRSQLHPHFLFNALNTISALTESDARTARRLMEQLGRLLRVSLRHASTPFVTLAEELTFLDDYLQIEAVRLEDRVATSVQADDDVLDARVPGFLLQPLVENAIRHGVGPRLSGGRVEVTAERRDARLHLRVCDNGLGLAPDWARRRDAGVGLRNTAARLAHLYSDAHEFHVGPSDTGGVEVRIELPLEPVSTAGPAEQGPR